MVVHPVEPYMICVSVEADITILPVQSDIIILPVLNGKHGDITTSTLGKNP